uniref:Small ribosomal subunit protein uS2c n=1 Tax=Jenufa perforata TaxID=993091 RepID=A0A0S2LNK4_9CHLO|nr:ribosomal protein S2 [Jenufa perforata]ALO62899.1 ribosomal protein S2 [Jenufa perforata]
MFCFTKKNNIVIRNKTISSFSSFHVVSPFFSKEKKTKKLKFSSLHCKALNSLLSNQKKERILTYQKKVEIKSGDILNLTVNSLISKKLGIAEFRDGSTIFLSNVNLGDQVKVKIVKVNASTIGSNYAIGKVIQTIKQSQIEPPVSVGEIFDLTINEKGPQNSGKVTFPNNYSLYIPNGNLGEKVKVMITRVKADYAFAKIIESKTESEKTLSNKSKIKVEESKKSRKNELIEGSQWNIVLPKTAVKKSNHIILNFRIKPNTGSEIPLSFSNLSSFSSFSSKEEKTEEKKEEQTNNTGISTRKQLSNKENLNSNAQTLENFSGISASASDFGQKEKLILFLKMGLGAKLGDKVRIKITKIIQTSTKNTKKQSINFALAKIVKISPISNFQKQQKIKKYLNKMLKNGMHFGDLKCHAFMRKFLWSKTKYSRLPRSTSSFSSSNLELFLSSSFFSKEKKDEKEKKEKIKTQESLSLLPFNHQVVKEKNGKIFRKKDRYLLNLLKTRRCLNKAFKQLAKYAASGRTFLFVGTKKPAAGLIARAALLSQNSFYVNTRWLGGMLTNWKTLLKSISKIQPIFREKQKILQNLLEKRYRIKIRLIKKINKLRNQSQQLLKKGKIFVNRIKQESLLEDKSLKNSVSLSSFSFSEEKTERSIPVRSGLFSPEKLVRKRKQYLQKGKILLTKYKQLLTRKNLMTNSFNILQEKAYQLIMVKKKLISKYLISTKKLDQLKILLILSNELQARKNLLNKTSQMKKILTVSSKKLPQLDTLSNEKTISWIVPNPPKEILQKILKTLEQENREKSTKSPLQKQTISTNFSLVDKKNSLINPNKKEKTSESFFKEERQTADSKETDHNKDSTTMKNKAILLSKFLNQFSHYSTATGKDETKEKSFLKNSIKKTSLRVQNQKRILIEIQEVLDKIQQKMIFCINNQKEIYLETEGYKQQFLFCKKILKNLKKRFQVFSSSQKLLKFLPKLKYLSTSKRKILETVQIFMKKFVDPKLRYPMEKIYEEKLKYQSKKRAATSQQKWQRLEKYFGGVVAMAKLKNQQIRKNVVILIGQQEEMNAVLECKKLGIKMFHLVDTDCNPLLADYVIPTNDDSRNSIQFLLSQILTYIRLAQKIRKKISLSI